MSKVTIEVIRCDILTCWEESREDQPVGWITFYDMTGNYHLCPCHAVLDNIKNHIYFMDMRRIDKERGD